MNVRKQMISGRFGQYECRIELYGFSFAKVYVYHVTRKNFLGLLTWDHLKFVYASPSDDIYVLDDVMKLSSYGLGNLYRRSVDNYENSITKETSFQ